MTKYHYELKRKSEIATSVPDRTKFIIDFLVELGAQGLRVVNIEPYAEPSGITDANQQPIPKFGVAVVVETVVDES